MNDRQTRAQRPAMVIISAFLLYLGGNLLGKRLGWPPIYGFALDIFALIAFIWALYELWKLMSKDN